MILLWFVLLKENLNVDLWLVVLSVKIQQFKHVCLRVSEWLYNNFVIKTLEGARVFTLDLVSN